MIRSICSSLTGLFVVLAALIFAAPVAAQDEAQAPETQEEPAFTADDRTKLRAAHASADKDIKALIKILDAMRSSEKAATEFEAHKDAANKHAKSARKALDTTFAMGRKVPGSTVPRIAQRLQSEIDTVVALLDSIKPEDTATTSIRNQLKQTSRTLSTDIGQLAQADLIAP